MPVIAFLFVILLLMSADMICLTSFGSTGAFADEKHQFFCRPLFRSPWFSFPLFRLTLAAGITVSRLEHLAFFVSLDLIFRPSFDDGKGLHPKLRPTGSPEQPRNFGCSSGGLPV